MAKVHITNNFVVKTMCKEDKIKEVFYDVDLVGFLLEIRSNQTKHFTFNQLLMVKEK